MSSIKSIVVVVAAGLGLLLAGGAQANMITNGSFENHIPALPSTGTEAASWYASATGTDSSVTFGSAVDWGVGPAPNGTEVAQLRGTLNSASIVGYVGEAFALASGTTYTYSFYVRSELNDGTSRASIYLQNLGAGADYSYLDYKASTAWQQYSFTFTPTADGSARVVVYNTGNTVSSLYLDEFQLNVVVPEPATAVLLGVLGTGLLLRRRRGHG